jgi:hypothetical protein
MLSRRDYEFITNKLISTHLRGTKLAGIVIKDNDLYGRLLSEIMMADWKFDGRGNLEGYRKQRFLWMVSGIKSEIGKLSREAYRVEGFAQEDIRTRITDENIFYEEFINSITNSKILTKKEKTDLSDVFINLKPIPIKREGQRLKSNINRGLSKLNEQYRIFKPIKQKLSKTRGIRTNSKKNSKRIISKDIGMDI